MTSSLLQDEVDRGIDMLESRKRGDRVWKGYFGGALGGVGETAGVAAFGIEFPVA